MKKLMVAVWGLALMAAPTAFAQTAPAQPAAATPPPAAAYYNLDDSTIGDLLDNPATKVILEKHVPDVVNGENIDRARGMTLVAVQPFSQGKITDEQLAAIDKELAAVPAPK